MCGRYAASRSAEDLVEELEVDSIDTTGAAAVPAEGLRASYNVAPTDSVPAVLQRPLTKGEEPVRRLVCLRWGLVPSWAKSPSIGNRMINARAETVADKPAFKRAFAARRCLLPADGYFEWYPTSQRGRNGKPVKQPFFIHPRDGGVLAMAGLYEIWRDPAKERDDPSAWLWTSTVLTTTAEDAVGHVHDRMPLLVEPHRWQAWLDPAEADRDRLLELLVPAAPGRLEAYPVSTEVNNVRNEGAQLIEPLPTEQVATEPATLDLT
jgi:putative SOS response-associated peptidase YedK